MAAWGSGNKKGRSRARLRSGSAPSPAARAGGSVIRWRQTREYKNVRPGSQYRRFPTRRYAPGRSADQSGGERFRDFRDGRPARAGRRSIRHAVQDRNRNQVSRRAVALLGLVECHRAPLANFAGPDEPLTRSPAPVTLPIGWARAPGRRPATAVRGGRGRGSARAGFPVRRLPGRTA